MAIKIESIKYTVPQKLVSEINFSTFFSLKEFIMKPKKYPHKVIDTPAKTLEKSPTIIK